MLVNLARTQPATFTKSYLEKFKMRYVSSQGMGGENPNIYVTLDKSKSIQTYEGLYALE